MFDKIYIFFGPPFIFKIRVKAMIFLGVMLVTFHHITDIFLDKLYTRLLSLETLGRNYLGSPFNV
jgi:hypothetical protein